MNRVDTEIIESIGLADCVSGKNEREELRITSKFLVLVSGWNSEFSSCALHIFP